MHGFKKTIVVDGHDVDFNGVCRASSLIKYMQSTAQQQLTENGMSYDKLSQSGKAFILSKIKLEFTKPVYEADILEAVTFPCLSRGYSFVRCYALSRGNEVIAKAISVWALIDTERKGLIKVNDFDLRLETYEAWDITIDHLRLPAVMTHVGKYRVAYADLDRNKHINNTRYADIFANFLPLNQKRITDMTISYINEAKFGEELDVFLEKEDDIFYLRTVLPDGKVNSESQIRIAKI